MVSGRKGFVAEHICIPLNRRHEFVVKQLLTLLWRLSQEAYHDLVQGRSREVIFSYSTEHPDTGLVDTLIERINDVVEEDWLLETQLGREECLAFRQLRSI